MTSALTTRLAMTHHALVRISKLNTNILGSILQTRVVQHSAEEDGAATQQPTAGVWIIRQNAPVLLELRESLEQEEHAADPPVKHPVGTEVDAVHAGQEEDPPASPCVIQTPVDRVPSVMLGQTGREMLGLSALVRKIPLCFLDNPHLFC